MFNTEYTKTKHYVYTNATKLNQERTNPSKKIIKNKFSSKKKLASTPRDISAPNFFVTIRITCPFSRMLPITNLHCALTYCSTSTKKISQNLFVYTHSTPNQFIIQTKAKLYLLDVFLSIIDSSQTASETGFERCRLTVRSDMNCCLVSGGDCCRRECCTLSCDNGTLSVKKCVKNEIFYNDLP